MYPKLVKLKNIKGIEELEFEPAPFTVLYGDNGVGKSTIAKAIVYMGERSHNPDMLRDGCEKGEIRIVVGDESGELEGAEFVCTVTPSTSTRIMRHPALGKISVSKSKEFFASLVNMVSLDPARFITASDEEQLKIFLEAAPSKLTADQLSFVPVNILKECDLDQHSLQVIERIRKELYDIRKEKNAVAKDKRATARTTREGLPEDSPAGNWSEVFTQKSGELAKLRSDAQVRAVGIRSDQKAAVDAAIQLCDANRAALRREQSEKALQLNMASQAEIDEIRKRLAERLYALEADTEIAANIETAQKEKALTAAADSAANAMEAARKEYEPKNEALLQEITTAKNMIDAHAKAQSQKELAVRMDSEAEAIEEESRNLTGKIDKLDALKSELLSNLPIPGLEVKDGRIYDGNIPLKATNSAEQFRVMFEIGLLLAGKMGFVVIDNSELLGEKNWKLLKDVGKKMGVKGIKILAARRTEGPLAIETEGAA